METLIHLDTNVLVWLRGDELSKLSSSARIAIDSTEPLATSPMALLELTYLHEIGRLKEGGEEIAEALRRQIGLELDQAPFAEVVAIAQRQSWTRDPFDRMIAAQALCSGADLITADEAVRANLPSARW